MADSFFGFDTALPARDDDESPVDEEEYDALNDETFGADVDTFGIEEDDWEQRHEQLAEIAEQEARVHRTSLSEQNASNMEEDIEASLGRLVLDDNECPTSPQKQRPTPIIQSRGWPDPPRGVPNGTAHNINNNPLAIFSQMLQQHGPPQQAKVPLVKTVEELEREMLLARNSQQIRPAEPPQKVDAMLRRPAVKPPPQNMQGNLADLLGGFPRPPPPHIPMPGGRIATTRIRPGPEMRPPNFPHPPPQGGILPFPPMFPHRIPPPPLMSHPPPPLNFKLPLPFPWMHQPPPPLPPPQQRLNGVHDPYAGLMSAKDRQWLINIQILQLNSQKPYVDDFYYTAYHIKLRAARERAGEKVEAPRREQRTLEPRAYTPAQFEGSLGKLQVVSVTAPRKIIDMEVVNAEPGDQSQKARESRRTKQTLLELERLYLLVLRLEDLVHPLPEARQSVTESREELVCKVNAILTAPPGMDERMPALLCIRKGRTLMSRLMPHLSPDQQLPLWISTLRGLWLVARRDTQDNMLTELLPSLAMLLRQASAAQLLALAQALSTPLGTRGPSPASAMKPPLPAALSNKFGASMVTSLLNRAAELPAESLSSLPTWQRFLQCLAEAAELSPNVTPSPLVALSDAGASQLQAQPSLANLSKALTLA